MAGELAEIRAKENPSVRDVADFLSQTGVKLVAEGANHPLSVAAEEFLEQHGVIVLPDFIINCGGLIGCWDEWEARHSGDYERIAQMGEVSKARVRDTVRANVEELRRSGIGARAAAERIVQRNRERMLASLGNGQ
jgi:glutamate dehydrogenase/leucine dehydrogenase